MKISTQSQMSSHFVSTCSPSTRCHPLKTRLSPSRLRICIQSTSSDITLLDLNWAWNSMLEVSWGEIHSMFTFRTAEKKVENWIPAFLKSYSGLFRLETRRLRIHLPWCFFTFPPFIQQSDWFTVQVNNYSTSEWLQEKKVLVNRKAWKNPSVTGIGDWNLFRSFFWFLLLHISLCRINLAIIP